LRVPSVWRSVLARAMQNICFYLLPHNGDVLHGIICDDPKVSPFHDAAHLVQEALGDDSDVVRQDGRLDVLEGWSPELFDALRAVDQATGSQWRLFTVASVAKGLHIGLRAVGIGSNQRKLRRASDLALALAVARMLGEHSSSRSPALQALAANAALCDHSLPSRTSPPAPPPGPPPATRLAETARVSAMAWLEPHHPEPSHVPEATDVPEEHTESSSARQGAVVGTLQKDPGGFVESAKRRLISWRKQHPRLSDGQHFLVKDLIAGRDVSGSHHLETHVISDLRTVLDHDLWKGQLAGKHWVVTWRQWEEVFADPGNYSFGRTDERRRANWFWYFGEVLPSPEHDYGSSGPVASDASFFRHYADPQQCAAVTAAAGCSAAAAGVENPACAESAARETSDSFQLSWGAEVPDPAEIQMEVEEVGRMQLVAGLGRRSLGDAFDALTVGTLTSCDTIPLGTDLDPQNHFNNLWIASKVRDPNGRLLAKCNLGCRVIDAENVGFSYGNEVKGSRQYDFGGVRRAVEHYRKQGIHVVVVSKRSPMKRYETDGVDIIIADGTDDIMVLKQAQARNCPMVSRDRFAEWRGDMRLARELRQWLEESEGLQVRFSWDPNGNFMPDFDLPTPVIMPTFASGAGEAADSANASSMGWKCAGCQTLAADGHWARWRGDWHWYCGPCWSAWS